VDVFEPTRPKSTRSLPLCWEVHENQRRLHLSGPDELEVDAQLAIVRCECGLQFICVRTWRRNLSLD
jgi:hypothetical protein